MDEYTNKDKICGICCLLILAVVVYLIIYPPPEACYVGFDNGFDESFDILMEDNFMNKDMLLSKGEVAPHSMKEIYFGAGEYRIHIQKENGELFELNNITLTKGKYIYNIGRKNSYYMKTCEYQVGGGVTFSERISSIGSETLFKYPEADYDFNQICPSSIMVPKGKRSDTRTQIIRKTNPSPPSPQLTPTATAIKNSLIGYWNFDEGSGSIVYDKSGYKNNGTIFGAVWIDGKYGKGLEFNGKSDYVEILDSGVFDNLKNFSLSMWIKLYEQSPSDWPVIFGRQNNNNQGLWCYQNQNSLDIGLNIGDGSKNSGKMAKYIQMPLNEWHLVTFIYNGNSIKNYLDGEYQGAYQPSIKYMNSESSLYIGGRHSGHFYGAIDEVRFYNYALTEDEIKKPS